VQPSTGTQFATRVVWLLRSVAGRQVSCGATRGAHRVLWVASGRLASRGSAVGTGTCRAGRGAAARRDIQGIRIDDGAGRHLGIDWANYDYFRRIVEAGREDAPLLLWGWFNNPSAMAHADFQFLLTEAWTTAEEPVQTLGVRRRLKMFKAPGFVSDTGQSPPELPLVVWRGTSGGNLRRMSWTLDRRRHGGSRNARRSGVGQTRRSTKPSCRLVRCSPSSWTRKVGRNQRSS